jgi:arabinofuranan 3-O-arabinosyltransferase
VSDSPSPAKVCVPLGSRIPWAQLWSEYRIAVVILMWGICIAYAGQRINSARAEFSNRSPDPQQNRMDGNSGHAQIDFGGQWVMGRQIATGHFHDLYERQQLWRIVREAYPVQDESPQNQEQARPNSRRGSSSSEQIRHDAEWMMDWFMGTDPPEWQEVGPVAVLASTFAWSANPMTVIAATVVAQEEMTKERIAAVNHRSIGGPLYPPIHAFYYAPLGFLEPRLAYQVFQYFILALGFVSGLGVSRLSRGRIWWSVATTAILLWPGFRPGIDLGQNHMLSLTLLIWGWVLATRGRDTWGGVLWGLIAFKPSWAVAFLLVPLLMRRWRFLFAMIGTGIALIVATLPFTGVQPWLDWLTIGREAAAHYNVSVSWISLSRDLGGIPRRFLIDFNLPEKERNNRWADLASWSLLLVVFSMTVGLYLWRGWRRKPIGLAAGFLFLGTVLCCYRFMYYDLVMSALAVAVLFADPRRFLRFRTEADGRTFFELPRGWWPLVLVATLFIHENYLLRMRFEATVGVGDMAWVSTGQHGTTSLVTPDVQFATTNEYPWDTLILLGLWLWCGWHLLRHGDWDGEEDRIPRPDG